MQEQSYEQWALEEFGHGRLNDVRNVSRLVSMAAGAAERGTGVLAATYQDMAERLGAYGFVENDRVRPEWITRASGEATVARSAGQPFVFVPEDQSSLTLSDGAQRRELGSVGTRSGGARGIQVMTAIAVRSDGVPLGIAGQATWARPDKASPRKGKMDRRPLEERESMKWLDVHEQVSQRFAASGVRPWFQKDRGADFWAALVDAADRTAEGGEWTTIRASANRRAAAGHDDPHGSAHDGDCDRLFDLLEAAPSSGTTQVEIRGSAKRAAGWATLDVRTAAVTLMLRAQPSGELLPAQVWAVRVRETAASCPDDEEPIEWTLLTTYPVHALADAELVVRGYTTRWRVEDFHKHWKGGGLEVESTQLGSFDAIDRWLRILAAVAMRTLRLTYLARAEPAAPASDELGEFEIAAATFREADYGRVLRENPGADELLWIIADLGGHMHAKRRMPGPKVLARGLERLCERAIGLRSACKALGVTLSELMRLRSSRGNQRRK